MNSRLGKSALTAFTVFSLFTLLAGEFWRNLIGWVPFFVMTGVAVVFWAVLLVRGWDRIRHRGFPLTLVVFLGWATLSLIWSYYRGATALALVVIFSTTIAAFGMAYLLPWSSFVRALGFALRWILGLSIVFELWVAVIIRHPILPLWLHVEGKVPPEFYWCEGRILEGGPIQGIMGNRNLLGFVALVAIVTFSVQLADKLISKVTGALWLGIAFLCIALTQSATVIFALILVLICGAFSLWARKRGDGRHRLVYWSALIIFSGLGLLALVFGPELAWIV
ncbi:MAG: hypothetical protein RLZZ600_15, partial [Actinomycetota bacterium]